MNIRTDWIVVDTNVWIFGLRTQSDRPACVQFLKHLNQLRIKIPRQVLLELQANLTHDEMGALFRLWRYYPNRIDIRWEKADSELVAKYQRMGCKLGDAAVSAHTEELNVDLLLSENRDFLEEIEGLPFRILRAGDALRELGTVE